MKTLSKLIIAIAILGFSSNSYGQYLSLKGGLNLSNMLNKDNTQTYSSNYTNRAGYHAGLIAGIRTGPIGVEGGLLISSKGFNYDYEVDDGHGNVTKLTGNTNLTYLDIPINLKLSAGLGGIRVFATAGPVFSFGLSGKSTFETQYNDEDPEKDEEKIKWGSTDEDNIKPMDIGLGFGGGIEIGNITLSANYNLGLVNLAPTTKEDNELKTKVLQFSLAFRLLGKR